MQGGKTQGEEEPEAFYSQDGLEETLEGFEAPDYPKDRQDDGFEDIFPNQQVYDTDVLIPAVRPAALGGDPDFVAPPSKRVKLDGRFEARLFSSEEDFLAERNPIFDDSGVGFFDPSENRDDEEMKASQPVGAFRFPLDNEYSQMLDLAEPQDDNGCQPLSACPTQQILTPLHDVAQPQRLGLAALSKSKVYSPPKNRSIPATTTINIASETRRLVLGDFLALRGKSQATPATVSEKLSSPVPIPAAPILATPFAVPEALLDRSTLRLLDPPSVQSTTHQYLASFNFIQKRLLVRSLASAECAVDLIERDIHDGVDLILDHDTATLFVILAALPSQCDSLNAHISHLSWRYKFLLIIFECFSAEDAYSNKGMSTNIDFFSPPVVKAVKKLRRGLGIAEGSGTKRVDCDVSWAFAASVGEAARFSRIFGDAAEGRAISGVLWGPRDWLTQTGGEAYEVLFIFSMLLRAILMPFRVRLNWPEWKGVTLSLLA